jgi:tetratricopeptide (TPR) repeat protein
VHEREKWIDGRRDNAANLGSTRARGARERPAIVWRYALDVSAAAQESRLAIAIAGLAIAFLLGVFFVSYGSKLYENWRERRLLHQATTLLQEGKLSEAAQMAQELAAGSPDSLAALSILADTAERQNLEEAVAWRERIARLLPRDPESQLNLASAALRFGKLDLAREALNRVSPSDRGQAQPFMSLLVGWRAQKVILPSRKNNSQLR